MFFLTKATRGGFILMLLLFYFSFIVGMSIYGEVYNDAFVINAGCRSTCVSVGLCTLTMLRMAFSMAQVWTF